MGEGFLGQVWITFATFLEIENYSKMKSLLKTVRPEPLIVTSTHVFSDISIARPPSRVGEYRGYFLYPPLQALVLILGAQGATGLRVSSLFPVMRVGQVIPSLKPDPSLF